MDFTLADSVLQFNDGKRGHAGRFSQIGLDVVTILTFIIGRTTPAGYVPALKRARKSTQVLHRLSSATVKYINVSTNQ